MFGGSSNIIIAAAVLVFTSFQQFTPGCNAEDAYDCEANFDKAEKCFQDLMMLGKKMEWNKETFQQACVSEFSAVGCIQEYKKKCIKGMASMVFNLLSKKFNATFNRLCSDSVARDEFLDHLNCIKGPLMSDNAKRCASHYQLRLEMIDQVDKNDRFPVICCGFHELKDCIGAELRAGCKSEESIEYFKNLVVKFVGDMNKMFCSDWKTSEVCRKNLPAAVGPLFQKISQMDLDTAEKSKRFKSFLRLLKHLIEVAGS